MNKVYLLHIRHFFALLFLWTAVFAVLSCKGDDEDIAGTDTYRTCSLEIAVRAGDISSGTASKAPESAGYLPGETYVDRVWLIVFRRAVGSGGEFVYYDDENISNGQRIVLMQYTEKTEADGNRLRYFSYTPCLKQGYEYKVVALGYSSGGTDVPDFSAGRHEENMFEVPLENGITSLSSLRLIVRQESNVELLGTSSLALPYGTEGVALPDYSTTPFYVFADAGEGAPFTDNQDNATGVVSSNSSLSYICAPAPEIFYGICTDKDGNEVIGGNYSGKIKGHLYRGMAKVEVSLPGDNADTQADGDASSPEYFIKWAALMADNVNTVTGLSSYDDFHYANTPVVPVAGRNGKWTLLTAGRKGSDGMIRLSAYVLPTVTRFAVRTYGYYCSNFSTDYSYANILVKVDTMIENDAENATGVVTVITDGENFDLKRNKSYKINYANFYTLFDNAKFY